MATSAATCLAWWPVVWCLASGLPRRWSPLRNALPGARERGYRGAYGSVARYAAALKHVARTGRALPADGPDRAGLTVRHAVALALGRPDRQSDAERATLRHAKGLHPEVDGTLALLADFAALVRRRPVDRPREALYAWETAARTLGAPEMDAFLARLKQDRTSVEAALVLPYSQGQTEGHITRLRALKRQMFGRAGFGLRDCQGKWDRG